MESPSSGRSKKRYLSDTSLGFILVMLSLFFVLALLEVGLRIIDYGNPLTKSDPFLGFEGTSPFFVKQAMPSGENFYVPAPNKPYLNQKFPVYKPKDSYRIFTFGGSTTQGVPWGLRGAFAFWLKNYVEEKYPGPNLEVVNLGVSGRGSSRVLQILKEAVNYDPDLFVIYTGQNETRDARFHATELRRSTFIANAMKILFKSRAIFLLYEKWAVFKSKIYGKRIISVGAQKIEHVLKKNFTKETFHSYEYYRVPELLQIGTSRDSATSEPRFIPKMVEIGKRFLKKVIGQNGLSFLRNFLGNSQIYQEEIFKIFTQNIREMIEISQKNQIKIIFLSKAVNPKEMILLNPYYVNSTSLRNRVESVWRKHYQDGIAHIREGHYKQALKDFSQVKNQLKTEYKDKDRLLNLYMGECYEKLGMYAQAKLAFDKRFYKAHLQLNAILKEVSTGFDVPVVDTQSILEQAYDNKIVGYNCFVDGIHMQLEAYKLIGEKLGDFLQTYEYIPGSDKSNVLREQFEIVEGQKEKALPRWFQTANVYTSLGWSAFHQGKLEEAMAKGKMAIGVDPQALQAHLLLGYVYAKKKEYARARKQWETLKGIWEKKGYVK